MIKFMKLFISVAQKLQQWLFEGGLKPTTLLEMLNSLGAAAVRTVLLYFFFQHVIVSQLSLQVAIFLQDNLLYFLFLLVSLLGHLQSTVLFRAERIFVKHSSSSDSK